MASMLALTLVLGLPKRPLVHGVAMSPLQAISAFQARKMNACFLPPISGHPVKVIKQLGEAGNYVANTDRYTFEGPVVALHIGVATFNQFTGLNRPQTAAVT